MPPLVAQQQQHSSNYKSHNTMVNSSGAGGGGARSSSVQRRSSASSPGRKGSSPARAPSREQESSIRRGAEIIRRQIQNQLAEMGEKMNHNDHSKNDTSGISQATGPQPALVEPEPPIVRGATARRSTSSKRQHQWNKEFSWKPAAGATAEGDKSNNNNPTTRSTSRSRPHVGASNQLERQQDLQNVRSGESFSDFSDPWKRDPTGKRLPASQQQHQPKEPRGNKSAAPAVEVELAKDYTLPPKPQAKTRSGKAILRSYPVTVVVEDDDGDNMSDSCASDINTVNEPMFDPFGAERDVTPNIGRQKTPPRLPPSSTSKRNIAAASTPPAVVRSSSASKRNSATSPPAVVKSTSPSTRSPEVYSPAIVSPTVSDSDIFTYDEGSRKGVAVSPASPECAFSSCSSSSSSERRQRYPQINPATGEYEDKDKTHSVRMSLASPAAISQGASPPRQQQQPQRSGYLPMGLSPARGANNNNNGPELQQLRRLSRRSSSNSDDEEEAAPVSAVVASPGGIVSQLTTPNKYKPRYGQTSEMLQRYHRLLESDAYRHAANAGFLWQSMVGQHVKFPENWWDGGRGPPLGCVADNSSDTSERPGKWMYLDRQTVSGNPVLNHLVKCRASGGRLLLHIIVQDLMTRTPIQDVVIGCFHPNAKGIREGPRALGSLEQSRDVWIAVRKRSSVAASAVDSLLYNGVNDDWLGTRECEEWVGSRSPLGHGKRVNNTNVRSVFGEKSPLETIFVAEDELYERLSNRILHTSKVAVAPAMATLQEFVFA